jgi:hypothetical protein
MADIIYKKNIYKPPIIKGGIWCLINPTFNNISVISWRSVLLVVETEHPEKTTDLPHKVVSSTYTSSWAGFKLTTLVVIGTIIVNPTTIYDHDHEWHDGPYSVLASPFFQGAAPALVRVMPCPFSLFVAAPCLLWLT